MNASQLRLEGVTIVQGDRRLVDGLDLEIRAGECWALLGRNGAGKTTLLHGMAGIRQPASGRIALEGRALKDWPARERARVLGLLPQDASEGFEATVLEAALAGRHPHMSRWANESPADETIALKALFDCGLQGFEQRAIQSLSGGERRRLALATLLTQAPGLMLLDEPLNHLDLQWQWCMLTQLRTLAGEQRAIVMSLHDPNLALRFCTHALLLDGAGHWEAGRVEDVVTPASLERIYGIPMRLMRDDAGAWLMPR